MEPTQEEMLARSRAVRCPFCDTASAVHYDNIEDPEEYSVMQAGSCSHCGASWWDVFEVVRVECRWTHADAGPHLAPSLGEGKVELHKRIEQTTLFSV